MTCELRVGEQVRGVGVPIAAVDSWSRSFPAHVTPGTERGTSAGEHDAPDVVALTEFRERARDWLEHLVVQRVATIRTVERDDRDAVVPRDGHDVGTGRPVDGHGHDLARP